MQLTITLLSITALAGICTGAALDPVHLKAREAPVEWCCTKSCKFCYYHCITSTCDPVDNTWCCAESRLMENFLMGELDGPDEMLQQFAALSKT
ncbi:hypothetical protein CC79DRAFT_1364914 [Sarocladium strictum]